MIEETDEIVVAKDVRSISELPKKYIMFYDDMVQALWWLRGHKEIMAQNKMVLLTPIRAYRYSKILAFELEDTDEVDRSKRDSVRDGTEEQAGPQSGEPS